MKPFMIALFATGVVASAQSVISAKAGVLHYIEGDVQINDQAQVMKPSKFPELKDREVLRTGEGRAELLLAPGSFLRLAENSAVRMESNAILATRLTLLAGTALVEVLEMGKLASLELEIGQSKVSVRKPGLYRLEMAGPVVKVYIGEVAVNSQDNLVRVTEGRSLVIAGELAVARFDKKQNTDELVQWADQRAQTLALANIHSARTVSNGLASNQRLGMSGWFYNSFYGMMTYVPMGRGFLSPFGYTFFSPVTVIAVYNPPVYAMPSSSDSFSGSRSQVGFNPGLGYNTTVMRSPTGYSGGGSAGATVSAPVAGGERAAGVSGGGGARGGGGGTSGGGGSPN
ncbi:MAG: FecR family protein [Bryobacter sp.]|jgi:hypothetical protein|nr:FecR family protein [Bryobacter sp. CoA8 C33]